MKRSLADEKEFNFPVAYWSMMDNPPYKKDFEFALKVANEARNPGACYIVAVCFEFGIGPEQDKDEVCQFSVV